MKFRPLHDRVLVRRLEEDERSSGGIIIPDTAKEKPMQGEVLAAGSGARNDKGEITPPEVKVDEEELVIMKESDLADHLRAHVLELVGELDLLGDGDAVLGRAWRAEGLVEPGAPWAPAPLPRCPIGAVSRPFREKFPHDP